MSCQRVKMPDGSVVLANVKPGAKLTAEDKRILAEWVQFCRDRNEKRKAEEQRERNQRTK